jgi:nitrogenase molybdenum-iron protein NifN
MAEIVTNTKACATNPLKSSAPLSAALAYLGIEGSVPLLHGSQGCTSFALVLAVRHFKEAIPLQTTALDEVATILGGTANLEQALLNLQQRMRPRFVGIASTALSETRGEDIPDDLRLILARQTALADTRVVFASTPDYDGALEDGWAKAVTAVIDALVLPADHVVPAVPHICLLPGVHQTAADIEALVDIVAAFGLVPVVLPDISGSLSGAVPDSYVATTMGGTRLADIAGLGRALHTIAIGEHMRAPAACLRDRTGVAFSVLPSLTGLAPSDRLVALLVSLSGRPVPPRLRRQRSQLIDAMLDGHFYFGGRRIAIAADPDLLCALADFFAGMGGEIVVAVASTAHSPVLRAVPAERVCVGDLADFEDAAEAAGAELLVTHSHGRRAAARLGVPLLRMGFPIFDRLGTAQRCTVGYGGTRDLIFTVANIVLAGLYEHAPQDFPRSTVEDTRHVGAAHATH